MNSHLCILPFLHFYSNPNGTINLCANSREILGKIPETSILDIWNSDKMKGIRHSMLNDIPVPYCNNCYKEEELGLNSKRINENKAYIDNIGIDNFNDRLINHTAPTYFDIRLGNDCNLMCRMCDASNSNKILEENLLLAEKYPSVFNSNVINETWQESDEFWEDMLKFIKHIDKIVFAGGEPSLNPKIYDFLNILVNQKLSQNIELRFNTNLTILSDNLLKLLCSFKRTNIECSIDGTNKVNSYIRYSSNWNNILINLNKLKNLSDNVYVYLSSTVQFYNLHNQIDLFHLAIHHNMIYYPNILYYAPYYQAGLMNINYKKEIYDVAMEQMDKISGNDFSKKRLKNILTYCMKPVKSRNENIVALKKITNILDVQRNQSIYNILPDFEDMIK